MADRKVLNKYYPPDFDPDKIQRIRLGYERKRTVRLMAPFSMRCEACGEYIYKGKKFNARKETVKEEDYLGIKIFRFFIRCPVCHAEITFKSDPKNADYVAETGASRNFESWREERIANEEITFRKEFEELIDPMKKLENRTMDSKREIDILESLDEIRTRNARSERVGSDDVMALLEARVKAQSDAVEHARQTQEDEDNLLAQQYFRHKVDGGGVVLKRLLEEDGDQDGDPSAAIDLVGGSSFTDVLVGDLQSAKKTTLAPIVNSKLTKSALGIVAKKPKTVATKQPVASSSAAPKPASALASLGAYSDGESNSD